MAVLILQYLFNVYQSIQLLISFNLSAICNMEILDNFSIFLLKFPHLSSFASLIVQRKLFIAYLFPLIPPNLYIRIDSISPKLLCGCAFSLCKPNFSSVAALLISASHLVTPILKSGDSSNVANEH